MKKLVVIFAVLALAAPLYAADVTINLTDEGSNVFRVDYNNASQAVSGFGMKISLSEGTISAISDFKEGESVTGDLGYGIFPGSVDIDTSGDDPVVNSWGTPIDMTQDPTNSGIGKDNMYIAMGTLYEDPNAPDNSETLFKFTIDCTGATSEVTITVTGDSVSAGDAGGVVLEDGSNVSIVVTGDLTACDAVRCPENGTETQKTTWENNGEPYLWCGDCWLCGDVTNDCQTTFSDVLQVFTYRSTGDLNGDVNMDAQVTFGDVLEVFTLRNAGGCDTPGAGCTPCTPLP